MRPFLLLQSRPEDEASDDEYLGFLRAANLTPNQLERIRVEAAPLPAIDLERYSGLIIGGGPYNVSKLEHEKSDTQKRVEADFARLLDDVVAKDFPLFGACYGVGLLGKHQGIVINDEFAEIVGPVSITITDEGRKDPLLAGLPDAFQVIVGHKEACEALPSHVVHLASTPTCPVQMFRVKNNIYVTQFHPELDMDSLRVRVAIYKHAGYFPPEEGENILAHAATADLSHAPTVLRNFIGRYGRPKA